MAFGAIAYFRFGVQSRVLFLFGVQSHIFVLAFRAIAYLHFSVQSRVSIPTWRSEPLPTFVLAFRATSSFRHSESCFYFFMAFGAITSSFGVQSCFVSFDIQSHHSFTVYDIRSHHATLSVRHSEPSSSYFQFWRSEPSLSHSRFRRSKPSPLPSLTFMVAFPVLAFRAIITYSFDIQSHHYHFSVSVFRAILIASSISAFRAIITSQFGVQSHHRSQFWHSKPSSFSILAFRAIIASQFWRSEPSLFSVWGSEPSSLISFGVQSHHRFSVLAFRAVITIFSLVFRAVITSQFWRSEPSLFSVWGSEPSSLISFGVQSHHRFSVLAFRAVITIFSLVFRAVITSQFWRSEPSLFSVWCSKPSSLLSLAFRAIIVLSFGVQSHHRFSVLAFRAITIFSLAFRAFITSQLVVRPLLILGMIFRVTFGDVLRGSLGPQCGFRDILRHYFLLRLEPLCSSVNLNPHLAAARFLSGGAFMRFYVCQLEKGWGGDIFLETSAA
ncbi:hypothetical protein VitviT2T_007184 [Vitis vinifera]|uniref:Uncharacterized protein n=1 Tax=Vitis vinifera TaxID=29760 RepID=A0ABY9BZ82_VITVI|nr:hypothetical protein VitviT2T_007184 [Vitis vinifera]